MNMCKYCKDKKMSKEEYNNFKNNISVTAAAIRENLFYSGGMYYPVSDLFTYCIDSDIKDFVIDELKKLDIEFFDNNKFYRVCV